MIVFKCFRILAISIFSEIWNFLQIFQCRCDLLISRNSTEGQTQTTSSRLNIHEVFFFEKTLGGNILIIDKSTQSQTIPTIIEYTSFSTQRIGMLFMRHSPQHQPFRVKSLVTAIRPSTRRNRVVSSGGGESIAPNAMRTTTAGQGRYRLLAFRWRRPKASTFCDASRVAGKGWTTLRRGCKI